MSFRRVNRSKKVPGVKLRPAPVTTRKTTSDSPWTHSSGLDSDDDTSRLDACPRPFKGFVLCATGINDKTSLFKLALELGAQSISDLTDRVTHLIAEEAGSAKYRCALENRIPIMHPSWIIESHKVWLRGDDVDVRQSIQQYRLPPFADVVVCISGIEDVSRRMDINHGVTKGGGKYVKQLERPVKVTHLLCGNTSEAESEKVRYAQKFNEKGEARIHVVWEDWFWDSLRYGGRFDENTYLVSNPRPPPRALPEASTPPPASSSVPEDDGLSSEIQNAETSATRAQPAAQEEEEIASSKRVPAVTLHLWQSILKPRGFEVQNGRLVRSPSKSQAPESARAAARAQRREGSPSRAAFSQKSSRRGTIQDVDEEQERRGPISALSSFQRSRSFAPALHNASTPRQPFQRTAVSRTSSFLQRPVGSVRAIGGISSDIPIASTSAVAGPSRHVSMAPEDPDALANVSERARTIFRGLRFRVLGEAKCANVKGAIEECGGTWVGVDDDGDVDFIVVRLVSGSNIFRQEADEDERAKYRTECWLERCIFDERVCAPEEHVAFAPLKAQLPIPGAEDILFSCSGLDHVEAMTTRRLLRALGIDLAPAFSRRSTHLLCPSGEGAKADKAREWGTPIVNISWLAAIAETGEIPRPQQSEDGVLDLPVETDPRDPKDWMASQRSVYNVDKGKGKERPVDVTMIDITNAENGGPRAQSLSYHDPSPEEDRQGQAEELESFGIPGVLLGESALASDNSSRHSPSNAGSAPCPDVTQPSEPSLHDGSDHAAIPTRMYQDRVPSSESPSPLRIPGQRTPEDIQAPSSTSTPVRLAQQATVLLQDRVMSLLGKRRSEEGEEEGSGSGRLQQHDSRGKRSRPLQRTKSNMSFAEHSSPAGSLKETRAGPTSGEEADAEHSFLAGQEESSLHVAYADPRQNGELDRLKFLLNPESGGKTREKSRLGMDADMDSESLLPQLPDIVASGSSTGSRKKTGGSRRGRAKIRKSGRR